MPRRRRYLCARASLVPRCFGGRVGSALTPPMPPESKRNKIDNTDPHNVTPAAPKDCPSSGGGRERKIRPTRAGPAPSAAEASDPQLDPPRSVLALHAAGVDKSHPRPTRRGPATSAAALSDPPLRGQKPRQENHFDSPRTGPETSAAEVASYSSPQLSHPRSGSAPPAASAVSNQHVTPAAPKDCPFSEAVGNERLGQPAPDPPRHPSPQRASAAGRQ